MKLLKIHKIQTFFDPKISKNKDSSAKSEIIENQKLKNQLKSY